MFGALQGCFVIPVVDLEYPLLSYAPSSWPAREITPFDYVLISAGEHLGEAATLNLTVQK